MSQIERLSLQSLLGAWMFSMGIYLSYPLGFRLLAKVVGEHPAHVLKRFRMDSLGESQLVAPHLVT